MSEPTIQDAEVVQEQVVAEGIEKLRAELQRQVEHGSRVMGIDSFWAAAALKRVDDLEQEVERLREALERERKMNPTNYVAPPGVAVHIPLEGDEDYPNEANSALAPTEEPR